MDDEKLRIEDEYARERRAISDEITECANRLAEAQEESDRLAARRKALADQIRSMRDKERRLTQKLAKARDQRDKKLAMVGKKQQRKQRKEHEEEEDLEYSEEEEEEEKQVPLVSVDRQVDPLLSGIRLETKRADGVIHFAMDHMTAVPKEKLLLWKPPGLEEALAQNGQEREFESFLAEVRFDQFRLVRDRAKTALSGSWVEEEAALADPTNNSRYKLRGYRALDVALRSPDCSFRTLGLLVGWTQATDHGAQFYPLEEMLGAWVAGFEGLQWPEEGLPLSLLPRQRNTGRRIVHRQVSLVYRLGRVLSLAWSDHLVEPDEFLCQHHHPHDGPSDLRHPRLALFQTASALALG